MSSSSLPTTDRLVDIVSRSDPSISAEDVQSFLSMMLLNAVKLRKSAPWKFIPGPWLLRVTVHCSDGPIERFAIIKGAANRVEPGIVIFNTIQEYQSLSNGRMVVFMQPLREVSRQLEGILNLPDNILNPNKENYPFFCGKSGTGPPRAVSLPDLKWFEAAMPAVGAFVAEAARLGGGGRHADSTIRAMSPRDVLFSLCEPSTAPIMMDGPSLANTFPCVQTVECSKGPTKVTIRVHLTATALSQANDQPVHVRGPVEQKTFIAANPGGSSMPNSAEQVTSKRCFVCNRTESDIRSRSSTGLQKCSGCMSEFILYCSRECQKAHWKAHKSVCRK